MTIAEKKDGSFSITEILTTLWSSRKLVAYIVGAVTVAAAVISLFMPNYYRSSAILLPETEKSKLATLGGLSDIAALAGVNTGEASLVKLYPTIIKSEAVLKNVIYARYQTKAFRDSVDLIHFWEIESATPQRVYEIALKSTQDELVVSVDAKTNVLSLSIETTEAQLSADIINRTTQELDRFIRTKRTTNASAQRKWIEARLSEIKNDLERSENSLKEFREKNRRVADSPELLLEQERLIREVQINSTLYTELKKQYEIVKIEEIKNIPIINIMDPGRASTRKSRPTRSSIVSVAAFLSLVGASGFVIARKQYGERIRRYVEYFRAPRTRS